MDEQAFRHARGSINRLPCVFDKALRARVAVCEYAVRELVGERERVACAQPLARARCGELNGLLRDKSAFALHLVDVRRALPHATVMKLQCGGLLGLKALVDAAAIAPSVHRLLRLAEERYGTLAELPFGEIVRGIAAWQGRRRRAPGGG